MEATTIIIGCAIAKQNTAKAMEDPVNAIKRA